MALVSTPLSLYILTVRFAIWNASRNLLSLVFHARSITSSNACSVPWGVKWLWMCSVIAGFLCCSMRVPSCYSFFHKPRLSRFLRYNSHHRFCNGLSIQYWWFVFTWDGFPLLSTEILACVVCKSYIWYMPYSPRVSLACRVHLWTEYVLLSAFLPPVQLLSSCTSA